MVLFDFEFAAPGDFVLDFLTVGDGGGNDMVSEVLGSSSGVLVLFYDWKRS